MDTSSGIQASLAGRYATALFELAIEDKALDTVEASIGKLRTALGESASLRALIVSPKVSRDDSAAAMESIATYFKLDDLTRRFVGVLAENRRLDHLPDMVAAFSTLAANHRGEVSAEVTSAFALSEAQIDEISKQLKSRAGREIKIITHVDPSILGGLVVKMGSQMIDSSIKSRLNALSQAMKG